MAKQKFSPEELLNSAAAMVTRAMIPQPSEVEEENFMRLFVQRATTLLEEESQLFLAMGPHVTKNGADFTEDMERILKFVEEETHKKYSFREGQLLIFIASGEGMGVWLEDRPS